MNYKSVRLPADFVEEIKEQADREFRTVPQQIQYWTELGRKKALREWQLQQMQEGLDEIERGEVVSHEEAMKEIQAILAEFKD
ncbi:MAG: hypothetical protein LBQ34_01525 [Alphaproteobacteria bacterium]|jgi:predicted transcriptional regulator|nr:hypothetical protein [Alphaproteobacteria bacterium]